LTVLAYAHARTRTGFLPWTAWVRLLVWLLLGGVVWLIYGINAPDTTAYQAQT